MSQLINLKGTSIYLLPVPVDASNFIINYINKKKHLNWIIYSRVEGGETIYDSKYIGEDEFKILGEITPTSIYFDCERYITPVYLMSGDKGFIGYANYQDEESCFVYSQGDCKEKSFRSRLAANGIELLPDTKLIALLLLKYTTWNM